MSKWIVIALGISVFLNGYLLRGIASSSDSGFAPGSAAEAAARILLASTGNLHGVDGIGSPTDSLGGGGSESGSAVSSREREREMRRRLRAESNVGEGIEDLQKWSKEDVRAMTAWHERNLREAQKVADKKIPDVVKVLSEKRHGHPEEEEEDDEDEESPPPSPIFVRTSRLRSVPKINGAPIGRVDSAGASTTTSNTSSITPSTPLLTVDGASLSDSIGERQKEIHLSPSTVALVPLGNVPETPRSLESCVKIFDGGEGAMLLNDEEIILLVQKGKVAAYALEKLLNDCERAVAIRRALICELFSSTPAGKTDERFPLNSTRFDKKNFRNFRFAFPTFRLLSSNGTMLRERCWLHAYPRWNRWTSSN